MRRKGKKTEGDRAKQIVVGMKEEQEGNAEEDRERMKGREEEERELSGWGGELAFFHVMEKMQQKRKKERMTRLRRGRERSAV